MKGINSGVDDDRLKSYLSVHYCESYGVVHITPTEQCCAPAKCFVAFSQQSYVKLNIHSFFTSQVRYTGYRDRPVEERQMRFQNGCREGHTEIVSLSFMLNYETCTLTEVKKLVTKLGISA